MVSALWKACATGDAAQVAELLREATSVDIEVKGTSTAARATRQAPSAHCAQTTRA